MSEMLVLEHKRVKDGKMLYAYSVASFSPITTSELGDNVVYKCYLPDSGRVARVPEMSKYFFFNKINQMFPKVILVTSKECMQLVSDNEANDIFTVNGHKFVKTYTKDGLNYITTNVGI